MTTQVLVVTHFTLAGLARIDEVLECGLTTTGVRPVFHGDNDVLVAARPKRS